MKNNGFLKPARLLLMMLIMLTVFCVPVKAEETEEGEVDNGIPIVYLNIDESRGTIDDMLESMDHSVYCYGTISIEVPEGFHYSDFRDTACESLENLEMSIRGRGNSTWEMQKKKPFKIKLEKKADVLGLGENKHWALLANVFDSTLMRDRITAWLGDEMGFDFTPRGVPVDVIMRGENYGTHYLGSYYLTENVRVDKNRLEIDE
ncbi:MAG: CotH kinase family protein, partial [Erysipelotrichaceae bacterium]|nr:CotH kinase family protein [Erysipelotrichaceae bacterium]